MTLAQSGIAAGPRLLPIMPADQQAQLDPYMATIVGYRKSGLSLNHIIGCPLDCGYCVRHFWGNFEVKIPHLLVPTERAIELLTGHDAFQPHITPIQVFNKATDPFLPGVKPHLFHVLEALDARGFTNHVLVITRFKVTAADMAWLEHLRHLRVTLLFTYSGITDPRVEPIAKTTMTVESIRTAAAHKRRTGVVLYWRPIVPGWNDADDTTAHVLDVGRAADALVFTGYYHKPENAEYLRSLGVEVPFGDNYHRRKTMPAEIDAKVVAAWRRSGIATPLFRKTSCGVAYAHQTPDYNGHWGVPELCDICPAAQRRRCADDHRPPTPSQVQTRSTCSATRATSSSTTATYGRTGSASSAATPSSTPCATRSGNSTTRTTCTPTAAPCSATTPTRTRWHGSRRCASSSPTPRGMKMTDSGRPVTSVTTGTRWRHAPLVALDLEGSGAQDGTDEAILEIAVVPLHDGRPNHDGAYATLVNPGRPVPRRPWLSPGLVDSVLSAAPPLAQIEPRLGARLNGAVVVGHNIGVDWRLLHRRCPDLAPAGLLDTLRLARHLHLPGKHALTTLLASFNLTSQVTAVAPGSQPHRALWDTVGTALLLEALVRRGWDDDPTLDELLAVASIPLNQHPTVTGPEQPTLLDL